jgi:hypothetical protein
MVFLSPLGGLLALLVVLPLAAAAVGYRRAAQGRRLIGLAPPPHGRDAVLPALAAVPLLLGLAATQPALRTHREAGVRTDAEAFFVVDVSRSMLASAGPHAPTRLARARADALRLRKEIPEVPAGVVSMTDRVLPHLLPTVDEAAFATTLRDAIGIERPPPEEIEPNATSCASLGDLPTQGYFQPSTKIRIVVLLTDGESRPFDVNAVGSALRATKLLIVRIWKADERVYTPRGGIEEAYRPDPSGAQLMSELASAAGGRSVDASSLGTALAALRADAGSGPSRRRGVDVRTRTLAPYTALLALAPLALVLWSRNGVRIASGRK